SFVAYSFIFNWLHAWVRRIEDQDPDWKPDEEQRGRLRRNLIVFTGFLVVGLSAFVTIIAAAMTLALDRPEWITLVAAPYALTITAFLSLFVYEIYTSMLSIF